MILKDANQHQQHIWWGGRRDSRLRIITLWSPTLEAFSMCTTKYKVTSCFARSSWTSGSSSDGLFHTQPPMHVLCTQQIRRGSCHKIVAALIHQHQQQLEPVAVQVIWHGAMIQAKQWPRQGCGTASPTCIWAHFGCLTRQCCNSLCQKQKTAASCG